MDSSKNKIGIGYRVGHLIVESVSPNRYAGYRMWICRCDCGGQVELDTRCLQRRTVTDCGCLSHVKPGQRDLTGRRFGKLVCMEPTEQRGNSGCTIWRCRCDCGQECLVESRYLLNGCKKTCGCRYQQTLKTSKKDDSAKGLQKNPRNTSGYNGVYYNKQNEKWIAQITIKKKTYYLGSYACIDEAVKIRKEGESQGEAFETWYENLMNR